MTTGSQSSGQDSDRLDSWKAIAAYLGKDVRTAFRWSKEAGMPVYRHAGSKRGAVYAYRSEIDAWIHSDRSKSFRSARSRRRTMFYWFGAGAVLVLAAGLVLFRLNPPLETPRLPSQDPPWVLFTHFDNRSGEPHLGGMVETALRRELAKSRHVRVVAPERIRDTLALMKLDPNAAIDADLGREICLRYQQNCAPLTGRVDRFGTNYLFGLEVLDPADGRIVASSEVQAENDNEILPAIQRLGIWLRNHMGEELAQVDFDADPLDKVTTPSLQALEYYSRGVQAYGPGRYDESEALFRQALEEDPDFASAYMFAFWALYYQGRAHTEEARAFLQRAMELAATTSRQEQLFIEGAYYDFIARDQEKSCRAYKSLAGQFPDHFWGAGNATITCGMRQGYREDHTRFSLQAAEIRPYFSIHAALALMFLERDFGRARPHIDTLKSLPPDQGDPVYRRWINHVVEIFPAEEYLARNLLHEVLGELERVERVLGEHDQSLQWSLAQELVRFNLALGRLEKAEALGRERAWLMVSAWRAYLAGDQQAFRVHLEELRAKIRERWPDPDERMIRLLGWNVGVGGYQNMPPLDVLVPLFDPEAALALVAHADETAPLLFSPPAFEAKLQLARGRQKHLEGRLEEAADELASGVAWFRDRGSWTKFPYYFLGAELLAVVRAEQGDLPAAYRVLEDAVGQDMMVNSHSAALYRKIQARLALLARELGRTAEAEALEAELAKALALADPDHPILAQIHEQQGRIPAFE